MIQKNISWHIEEYTKFKFQCLCRNFYRITSIPIHSVLSIPTFFLNLISGHTPRHVGISVLWPGIEPVPPALEGEVFTPGPPVKSHP